jgi:hypothetical protein
MKEIKRISILGTGRVANQLASILLEKGYEIDGIYGRSSMAARKLAEKVKSRVIENLLISFI